MPKKSSVKKQRGELDQTLHKEIKRCEGLLHKYATAGAAHTADFAGIKGGIARAAKALEEKSMGRMALSYVELRRYS